MAFPNAVAVGQLRPYSIDRYGTICSVHLDQPHQGKRSRPPWHQAIRKKNMEGNTAKGPVQNQPDLPMDGDP